MTGGRLVALDIGEQRSVLAAALAANAAALDDARARLGDARVVRLLGIGSSRHAAGYGATALDVLAGLPATVLPAPGAAVPLPRFGPDQPVVVLSQSGATPSLVDAARAARAAGAPIISITNAPGSPLESLAEVALQCGAGDERVVAATKSVTTQAALLRALAQSFEPGPLLAGIEAALVADVDRYVVGDPPEAVVCGGFGAEWIADEIALKLAEMAGWAVSAEPLVEHLHGPVAARGAVLAFVDPADPNAAGLGGETVVVVPTPPTGDASLDAIVTLVLGQRVARAWALHLGEDPDAPRGLQKVTSTR